MFGAFRLAFGSLNDRGTYFLNATSNVSLNDRRRPGLAGG